MQYTLKQLRYFAAAAEEGSVTGAAKAIRVSQPSISEAIAHLEDAFDLQLFVRHHARGLALTPAGQRLLVEARSLLAHAGDLSQSVGGLADKLAGGPGGRLLHHLRTDADARAARRLRRALSRHPCAIA